MHRSAFLLALLAGVLPTVAAGQDLSAAERASATARVREMAACVERHHDDLQRVLRLLRESEQQRDQARDARVRLDAERAIDALIARAARIQAEARGCTSGAALPSPGTTVVERPPPPDPAADAVASAGGTVREVERDALLTRQIHVVRAEQVDGEAQVPASAVRAAVRAIAPQIARCYEAYLDRGTLTAHRLELVFTVRGPGRARDVAVERSSFSDATFERCVRTAAQRLSVSSAPPGEATFSYQLRFGAAPRE